MSFLVETIVRSVAVPAAASVAVLLLWRRACPQTAGPRHAAAWAVGGGFLVGYLFLPSAPVVPASHWQWLPYVGLVAMILAPVGLAEGVRLPERWGLHLVLAVAAAWFLVPDWAEIEPQRPLYFGALAGSLLLLVVVLDRLSFHIPDASMPVLVCVTAFAGAVVLAQSGSMKFAHLAGVIGAVNLGYALVTVFGSWSPSFQSAVPVVVILLGGLMFAGDVNSFSDVPRASYVLVPVAPLGAAVCLLRPVRSWPRSRRIAVQAAGVLVPLAAGVALALQAEPLQ